MLHPTPARQLEKLLEWDSGWIRHERKVHGVREFQHLDHRLQSPGWLHDPGVHEEHLVRAKTARRTNRIAREVCAWRRVEHDARRSPESVLDRERFAQWLADGQDVSCRRGEPRFEIDERLINPGPCRRESPNKFVSVVDPGNRSTMSLLDEARNLHGRHVVRMDQVWAKRRYRIRKRNALSAKVGQPTLDESLETLGVDATERQCRPTMQQPTTKTMHKAARSTHGSPISSSGRCRARPSIVL